MYSAIFANLIYWYFWFVHRHLSISNLPNFYWVHSHFFSLHSLIICWVHFRFLHSSFTYIFVCVHSHFSSSNLLIFLLCPAAIYWHLLATKRKHTQFCWSVLAAHANCGVFSVPESRFVSFLLLFISFVLTDVVTKGFYFLRFSGANLVCKNPAPFILSLYGLFS